MADTHSGAPPRTGGISLSDKQTRGVVYQVLTIAMVVYAIWWIIDNTATNMEIRNIRFGFEFLSTEAGFGIIQSLIDYNESSSYGRVFLVGLLNTLIVAIVGCILATLLGFVVGVGRLSRNWLIRQISTVYVETLRNIPLLLQIFFWYHAVLKPLPGPRDVHQKGEEIWYSLTNNGLMVAKPVPESGFIVCVIAFIAGIVGTVLVKRWAHKRQMATGQQFPVFLTSLGLILGIPLLVFLVMGMPLSLQPGEMGTFRPANGIGLNVIPEFIALLLALVAYTAAFIAEIVRAGIQSVSHGQTEASYALGLRPGPTLRLIIIPQALRVIVPPLTSQYLNLTKNSSLATAIAYPDLVATFAGTVLNQTGKAVEIIMMTMFVYLAISLLTSMFMNWYNARVKLVER